MARLSWGATGERLFETGTDRGVLYLDGQPGVPWNGLKAVSEAPDGGSPMPYYIDGYKYLNVASAEEFRATLEAFSAPREFGVCDGTVGIHTGLFATQQPRKSFGLAYRTLVGNDVRGVDHGYKIHLVYNALASPSTRGNKSVAGSIDPLALSWGITTMPPRMLGLKPTAHFIIDSTLTPRGLMQAIEDILYGSVDAEARLPEISEIIELFGTEGPLIATNLVPFSSMELESAPIVVYRNRALYTGDAPTGTSGFAGYRTNLSNPGGYIRAESNDVSNTGSGGITGTIGTSSMTPVTPGERLQVSAEIRGNFAAAAGIQFYDAAGAFIPTTQSQGIAVGLTPDWQVATYLAPAAPANAAYARSMILREGPTPIGAVLEMRAFTHGSLVPLSGRYSPIADLVPSWDGVADGSPSRLTGARPVGISSSMSASVLHRSTEWSAEGLASVKVAPNGDNAQSYGSLVVSGLTPGGTYTAIAKFHLEEAQKGLITSSWYRCLMAQSSGMIPNNVLGNHALNERGDTDLRVVFTLAASDSVTLFLMNGSDTTPGWFDEITLVEGDYQGPGFTGNTDDVGGFYAWTGTENNSPSTFRSWYL